MLFSEQVSSPSRQSADLLENKMSTAKQHEFKADNSAPYSRKTINLDAS